MNTNVENKPTFVQIIDSKYIVKVVRYREVYFSIYTCLISVTIELRVYSLALLPWQLQSAFYMNIFFKLLGTRTMKEIQ